MSCEDSEEQNGGLCYPKCNDEYNGEGYNYYYC